MRREFKVASKSWLYLLEVWRGMFCGIVSRIRGALSAELVIFLLGVMGNHYGAIWYGFEFPLLPPLRKGLPPLSIRHRSSQTKRLMMVLGNQSLMPRTSGSEAAKAECGSRRARIACKSILANFLPALSIWFHGGSGCPRWLRPSRQ